MTLDTEMSQSQEILAHFFTTESVKDTESMKFQAVDYIPSGAKCTDVSVIGEVVYLDYRINNIRYLVGYHRDGTVEKVVRELNGDKIYSVDSENPSVMCENVNENKAGY